ncbi:MAG: Nif3-like dinuclear metal center hexameric protein [Bacteroidales bacterium]|nr:Nif3-like dinuclear metal center hexameric protein [Bacteroidales bacterium]
MRVGDVVAAVEGFAPASVQESWDNSGLIIGSPADEVHGVLVGFDCTAALVEKARQAGCDMIVTHHPLIFKGIRRITPEDPVGEAVMLAIRYGIAVYAAHTSADKVSGGVSWAMAGRLGLQNTCCLDPEGAPSPEGQTGLGVLGDLPEEMSGEQALDYVKTCFSLKVLRHSRPVERVRRVALCGGSGGSLIATALASGASLYISGDITYHQFFTPRTFMIADIGHFESEIDIVGILAGEIRRRLPSLAVHADAAPENPVFWR